MPTGGHNALASPARALRPFLGPAGLPHTLVFAGTAKISPRLPRRSWRLKTAGGARFPWSPVRRGLRRVRRGGATPLGRGGKRPGFGGGWRRGWTARKCAKGPIVVFPASGDDVERSDVRTRAAMGEACGREPARMGQGERPQAAASPPGWGRASGRRRPRACPDGARRAAAGRARRPRAGHAYAPGGRPGERGTRTDGPGTRPASNAEPHPPATTEKPNHANRPTHHPATNHRPTEPQEPSSPVFSSTRSHADPHKGNHPKPEKRKPAARLSPARTSLTFGHRMATPFLGPSGVWPCIQVSKRQAVPARESERLDAGPGFSGVDWWRLVDENTGERTMAGSGRAAAAPSHAGKRRRGRTTRATLLQCGPTGPAFPRRPPVGGAPT